MGNMMGNMMGAGGLGMLLLLIALIALVVWLVKALFPQSSLKQSRAENDTALQIARERLAKGEISHDEFENVRQDLTISGHDSRA